MWEEQFNRDYRHQVLVLGNAVRGLELIRDCIAAHPNTGAATLLAPHASWIVSRLPLARISAQLLSDLRAAIPSLCLPPSDPGVEPANRVLLPLIERDRVMPSGMVREMWLEIATPYQQNPTFPEHVSPSFREAVTEGAFAAARLLERHGVVPLYRVPDDFVVQIERGIGGGNPPMSDSSVWLGAFLSYFSLMSGLPIPGGVAATGSLEGSRPAPSRWLQQKVDACSRERADLQRILVLGGHDRRVATSVAIEHLLDPEEAVTRLWGADWSSRIHAPKLSFYAALDRAHHAYARDHDVWGALQRFQLLRRFLDGEDVLTQRYDFICDWRIASCYTHLWQLDQAEAVFARRLTDAETLLAKRIIDAENYADFFASYATYRVRRGSIDDAALQLVGGALAQAHERYAPRASLARLCAGVGRMLQAAGVLDGAEEKLLLALEFCDGEQRPKKCLHLVRFYSASLRFDAARHWLLEAENLIDLLPMAATRRVTRLFARALGDALERDLHQWGSLVGNVTVKMPGIDAALVGCS